MYFKKQFIYNACKLHFNDPIGLNVCTRYVSEYENSMFFLNMMSDVNIGLFDSLIFPQIKLCNLHFQQNRKPLKLIFFKMRLFNFRYYSYIMGYV